MRIAVSADERVGVADALVEELCRRGHEPIVHRALTDSDRDDRAWASEAGARDVADGRAEQAVVCCCANIEHLGGIESERDADAGG